SAATPSRRPSENQDTADRGPRPGGSAFSFPRRFGYHRPSPADGDQSARRCGMTRPTPVAPPGAERWLFDDQAVPQIRTELPGPRAQALLERDGRFVPPSYPRVYPLVVERGSGAVIQDVDGNLFLDFTAGIAVNATGHCHPHVVAAITDQAHKLLHMSGTDF